MNHTFRVLGSLAACVLLQVEARAATSTPVFNKVLYYDGYASKVDAPTPAGVIRHRNDLYARRLTEQELQSLGRELTLNIVIKAACDNYDRIGNFNLALVPKGASTYAPDAVQRIELGRFITPFMDKNRQPDQVPYSFRIDNVADILKDRDLNARFDFWAELEVFGVPYAANEQVAGCQGRNDVFYGSAEFVSESGSPAAEKTFLLPLNFKKNLNNYEPGATDELTKTERTIAFHLDKLVENARFYLITSNHGANAGGEEYNRRNHFIYFDDQLLLTYKPGGVSCEPYRVYNTQPNGIYGRAPRTPEQWASFSNWCPGQVIPIREVALGDLPAGNHTFRISVPDAIFVEAQGYIPVSLYLQGTTRDSL
ncbi:peptide-N-glycosidase F-related protein [Oligoflexus tunisiensis]|uniref:peptide-N-glycosidase F-related protein n=1 Tax=Oligoflexus tunisiensis TaxID=708132 RepID=UPI000AC1536F|nr:peptide-N-glycosidase F-related protein [Oligoflexus tunisiensis]